MSTPAIAVERVSKTYTQRPLSQFLGLSSAPVTQALREISFSVNEGETVGLLGPNGAGKTTLLKILSTLLYPTSGRVVFHGRDSVGGSDGHRPSLGLVTCDDRSFYWRLTGRQNLWFFATLFRIPPKRAAEKIAELLDTLGLTYAADRPYGEYSSGMKQKLAIARGLLSDPAIVLYDEPTRSLDPLSAQQIRRWLLDNRSRSPRQTHLIATNQLNEAEQLCNRVMIINRGSLVASGTIDEIRRKWQKRDYTIHQVTYRGIPPVGLRANPVSGLLEVEQSAGGGIVKLRVRTAAHGRALSTVLSTILNAGGEIVECTSEHVPFDDVFCSLVLSGDEVEAEPVAVDGGVR